MIAAFGTWGGWPALTAIGTVGAVIVAVGLQAWLGWRERRQRPVLTLSFDEHMRADEAGPKGVVLPYLRLAVTNAEGRHTAQDVEILVLDIEEFATSPVGSGGKRVWLANPALGWANSRDRLPRMSIPPGTTRYLDVCRWVQVDVAAELDLVLCIVPEPGSNRHMLPPSGWRIRLAATMRNGDATFWEVEVSYEYDPQAGISQLVNLTAEVRQVESASA